MLLSAAALVTVVGLAGACEVPEDSATATDDKHSTSAKAKPAKEKKAQPDYTVSQENAIEAAQNYVDIMPFSRAGLIDQLSSEAGNGFPVKDATFAVDHIKVDWNAEAVEAAKNYLDTMAFSRAGLIQQLESPAGSQFTHAQAAYATNQAGL
jgi:hypothetical protein